MIHTGEESLLINKTFILLPALYSVMQASVSTRQKHFKYSYDAYIVISGRLPAPADYCIRRKKKSTDYPHWWITRTLCFFGGENVTLR